MTKNFIYWFAKKDILTKNARFQKGHEPKGKILRLKGKTLTKDQFFAFSDSLRDLGYYIVMEVTINSTTISDIKPF